MNSKRLIPRLCGRAIGSFARDKKTVRYKHWTHKDAPCLALAGEQWDVYCDYSGQKGLQNIENVRFMVLLTLIISFPLWIALKYSFLAFPFMPGRLVPFPDQRHNWRAGRNAEKAERNDWHDRIVLIWMLCLYLVGISKLSSGTFTDRKDGIRYYNNFSQWGILIPLWERIRKNV